MGDASMEFGSEGRGAEGGEVDYPELLLRHFRRETDPLGIARITDVEAYAREPEDHYTATVAADFAAFVIAVLYLQEVVASASSLQEIATTSSIPVHYLVALIVLFGFIVADRCVYSLGWHLGKAVLHVTHVVVVISYCLATVWSPFIAKSTRLAIQAFLFFKCISFWLASRQLKTGYPTRASYRHNVGRQQFVFYRHTDLVAWMAF